MARFARSLSSAEIKRARWAAVKKLELISKSQEGALAARGMCDFGRKDGWGLLAVAVGALFGESKCRAEWFSEPFVGSGLEVDVKGFVASGDLVVAFLLKNEKLRASH